MKKIIAMIALLWLFANTSKITAQNEEVTSQDQVGVSQWYYVCEKFQATLEFIGDDSKLLKVSFSWGEKWLDYEIIESKYKATNKVWVIKVRDGIGNIFTLTKGITTMNIGPINGKYETLQFIETGGG